MLAVNYLWHQHYAHQRPFDLASLIAEYGTPAHYQLSDHLSKASTLFRQSIILDSYQEQCKQICDDMFEWWEELLPQNQCQPSSSERIEQFYRSLRYYNMAMLP